MLWPGLGEQLWPARVTASERDIKLGANRGKEKREFYHRDQENPPWKALSPFSWWIVYLKDQILKFRRKNSCTQRCLFLEHTLESLACSTKSTLHSWWMSPKRYIRSASLQSSQWYLCRGETKAITVRDNFNMIQRKGWTPEGWGNYPFLFHQVRQHYISGLVYTAAFLLKDKEALLRTELLAPERADAFNFSLDLMCLGP